nr:MAG TPA_asm: hypothetical protein [Caudoviricetes sp.]
MKIGLNLLGQRQTQDTKLVYKIGLLDCSIGCLRNNEWKLKYRSNL